MASKTSLDYLLQLFTVDNLVPVLKNSIFGQLIDAFDYITDKSKQKTYILDKILPQLHVESIRLEFVHILLHTGQDALAQEIYSKCIDMIDLNYYKPSEGYAKEFSFGMFSTNDNLRQTIGISTGDYYTMNFYPRGYCLLINNYFTAGTYKEMQRFRNIFYQLQFVVKMKKNLNSTEIATEVLKYANRTLADHCSFVVMIITHGNENKQIEGFDGETIDIETLIDRVNNANVINLQNKPRIFFINCCRGTKIDGCVQVVQSLSGDLNLTPICRSLPTRTDTLICYSTLDGFLADVDWLNGTNFGNALANSLVEMAWNEDLNRILLNANDQLIAKACQCNRIRPFEWTQNLRRLIFFLPYHPSIIDLIP